jgi:hypothetical protein
VEPYAIIALIFLAGVALGLLEFRLSPEEHRFKSTTLLESGERKDSSRRTSRRQPSSPAKGEDPADVKMIVVGPA